MSEKFSEYREYKQRSTNPFDTSSVSSRSTSQHQTRSSSNSNILNEGRAAYNKDRRDLLGDDESDRPPSYRGTSPKSSHHSESRRHRSRERSTNHRQPASNEKEESDEEVAILKNDIRSIKQDSLAETRKAVSRILDTEQTATQTLSKLGDQSTKIANIGHNVDTAKAHTENAIEKTNELKQLNRSIFLPSFKNPFTRKSREQKELARLENDHRERNQDKDELRKNEWNNRMIVDHALKKNERMALRSEHDKRSQNSTSEKDRQKYQFEADSEDDEMEGEIDKNLDILGDTTSRLKNMALAMNGVIESQNNDLDNITRKIDPLTEKLVSTSHKISKIR